MLANVVIRLVKNMFGHCKQKDVGVICIQSGEVRYDAICENTYLELSTYDLII